MILFGQTEKTLKTSLGGGPEIKTLRDEFAMAAMGVFIQGGRELLNSELAELAYEIADAMLKERMK